MFNVGPVGMWMPWNPQAYKTGKVEYLEDELNQLMSEKNLNEKQLNKHLKNALKNLKDPQLQKIKRLQKQAETRLTLNIDDEGNLIGVANMNTTEAGLSGEVSSADIRKELFEGGNVRTRATDKVQEEMQNVGIEISEKKED